MTMEKTRSASSSSSSSSSFSRFSSSLCRRRAIPKSWSRLEKKSAVLFRTCIIAGMMVLLFANEREGRKSSIFPPMSAEATAVHPATQITHDDDVNTKLENSDNVFLRRKAKPDAAFEEKIGRGILTTVEREEDTTTTTTTTSKKKKTKNAYGGYCPSHVHLKWRQRVSSSVYATPILVDMHGDGHKEVLVNTFVHAIEALESETGQPVVGNRWPIFHESKLHGSSVVYIDDGNVENNSKKFIVATYDGEVLEFNARGDVNVKVVRLPRAKVTKDWFKEKETERKRKEKEHLEELRRKAKETTHAPGDWEHSGFDAPSLSGHGREPPPEEIVTTKRRKLLEEEERASTLEDIKFTMDDDEGDDNNDEEERNDMDDNDEYEEGEKEEENRHNYREEEEEEEEEDETRIRERRDANNVYVDAHVLCSPVVADVDSDGRKELILAVSYFFDEEREDLSSMQHRKRNKIEAEKYLATGIVLLDIANEYRVKKSVILDISVEATAFRARAFSQPTVLDIDKDGTNELFVATSTGNVHVLNGKTLENKNPRQFPKQMGEIQAPIVVADFDNNGYYEFIACDLRGNVAVYTKDGDILWEKHLQSAISANPTLGDVDGDHFLEVVVGTHSGAIHVLSAETGEEKYPFPFYTGGRILAPVALGRVRKASSESLSLVATSFDGYIYIIDGKTGCRDVIDVGETSYSIPLIDDLSNSGYLSIVLATMNGEVHCFEAMRSGPRAHPLEGQQSQFLSTNLMTHRNKYFGIYGEDRDYFDVRGEFMTIKYRMRDNRSVFGSKLKKKKKNSSNKSSFGPYVVTVTLNALDVNFVEKASKYYEDVMEIDQITLRVPKVKSRGEIFIEMKDGSGVVATDSYSVSFHERHYRILKWIVALPFVGMTYVMKQATERMKTTKVN